MSSNKGFTLLEVMIALSMFSVFFIVFLSSQSSNVLSSDRMKLRLSMHNVAENVINDLLISPPPLSESLTLKPQSFKYENDDRFEYTIEYKQFELPNIFNLAGGGNQDDEEGGGQNQQSKYMDLLYEQVKENIKQALWQVRVTIIDKDSKYEYWLTAWLRNPDFEIKANLPKI